MVTGYDHLLFILGVIFFLYRLSHVALYVTMFSIGHSITLLTGVLGGIHVDPYLIDAVIGLSVVYKAFDNLDGIKTLFGFHINQKAAVLGFGLFHGFGLATKLQALALSKNGLLANMLSFNVGVELGQILMLALYSRVGVAVPVRRRRTHRDHHPVGTSGAHRLALDAGARRAVTPIALVAGLTGTGC